MPKQHEESGFNFFRLGESYTSLILGIVVVVVSTVLLLSFVHNKNKASTPEQKTKVAQHVTPTPKPTEGSVTIMLTPTKAAKKVTPTTVKAPPAKVAKKVTPTPTAKVKKPTAVPTKVVVAKKVTPTKAKAPTAAPTKVVAKKVITPTPKVVAEKPVAKKGTYTVAKGDNLWVIAEKNYKSGYNWVDIARANNLNDPNNIHVGDKLVLPKVESKVATVVTPTKSQPTKAVAKATPTPTKQVAKVTPAPTAKMAAQPGSITGTKYTVVQGDNLWTIAVRAYADGYQWVKIAQANKLFNPDLIHPGNVLELPRK